MSRPFYKEHNNPVLFGSASVINNFDVYNGDAQISCLNLISSVFYDMVVAQRAKKSGLWKIIAGAVLVLAAVAVAIFVPGGIAVAGSLLALSLSYGVSLAVSGIKFEQFKSMIEVDYEKGLKDTVVDGGVFATIRDTIQRGDDTIRWFADRVSNIYIESSVPFGLRDGLTSGVPDFIDAPSAYDEPEFRTYLTEKLTTLDRDQGSGRLYKGYASSEYYDINPDYLRINKQKIFYHLPIEYDCCSMDNETFPMRVWYSEQSFQEELVDNYRVFLPNNYRDIEGEHGEITDLYRLGNGLFIHTREALWQLPQNVQERVTGEIVSFLGTGEFFSLPVRKVIDDNLGSGGTQHKWATIKTRNGVLFINEIENKIYLHSDTIRDISSKGLRSWFENNLKSFLSQQLYQKLGVNFLNDNNPANRDGIGYISAYDTRYERVVFTKRDFLVVPDKLAQLILVDEIPTTDIFAYNSTNGLFYQGTTIIHLDNIVYFQSKCWTISYSFYNDPKTPWSSWHSYLPNYYIHNQNSFYATYNGSDGIWKFNSDLQFQTYFGQFKPFIVEIVKMANPLEDTITEYITFQTTAQRWDAIKQYIVDEQFITFNKMMLFNSRQNSGEISLVVKDTQANPQDWYAQQITHAPGVALITRKERDWTANDFRDIVTNYAIPMFTNTWVDVMASYPIDKILNSAAININKPWDELQSFRDKYVVIRLKYDNFDNVNLTLNHILETGQDSDR